MKRATRSWIAILLTVIMAVMTPLYHVSTAYAEIAQSTTAEATALRQVNAHFGEAEEGELTVGHANREKTVVKEDETKREKYSKEFILADNSRMIAVYSSAVHFEDDGAWVDIDNTLVSAQVNGRSVLQNRAN